MRRLLNKKGSVLFLVVVVMSILIIAASATFYIVNNQHSSVNVRYSSEQSYQTAVSVSKTVSDYIDGYITALSKSGKEMGKYKDSIIGKMVGMSVGTSNDITSDIPLDDGMGSAKVTIRKTAVKNSGDNTVYLFEITTNAEVNGETSVITQVKEIVTGPTEYFTRFLTSTGNYPEDVNITANKIVSSAYFENDFTRLSNADVNESIYSSGTFCNGGIKLNEPTKEIVVAENFYNQGWGNPIVCDKIYVGGNLETSGMLTVNQVYVLGDVIITQNQSGATFYIDGDCTINAGTTGATFFINGNVTLKGNIGQGTIKVKGDVIIDGFTNAVASCEYGGNIIEKTPSSRDWEAEFTKNTSIGTPFGDADVVSAYISNSTGKQKYGEWAAEKYFVKTFTDYVENVSADYSTYNIKNAIVPGKASDTWTPDDDPDDEPDWINGSAWNADGTSAVLNQKHTYLSGKYGSGTAICYINESCALQGWSSANIGTYSDYWTNGGGLGYIVIDTGPKRDNGKELYILLDKGSKSYFSFGAEGGTDGFSGTQHVNVLIKGDYPVIFILPEGTKYMASPFLFVGHANLAVEMCGCVDYNDLVSTKRMVFNSFGTSVLPLIESYIDTTAPAQPSGQPTAIIKSGAGIPDFHNNIYFVSNSSTDIIDMYTQIFHGYIYAPNTKFNVNLEGGGNSVVQFLGGMIVGSYNYSNFGGVLAYLTPYDYKDLYGLTKKTDIVKKLMSIASGGTPSGDDLDSVIIKPSTGASPTIGYK